MSILGSILSRFLSSNQPSHQNRESIKQGRLDDPYEGDYVECSVPEAEVVEEYLASIGISNDVTLKEKELLYILIPSLDNVRLSNNQVQVRSICGETDPSLIKKRLIEAIRGPGSLTAYIQAWFTNWHWSSLIPYLTDQISFEQFIKQSTADCFDDKSIEEWSEDDPPCFLNALDETSFRGYANGHSLEWSANESTAQLLDELGDYVFVEALVDLPEDVWLELFFNDEWQKTKVFSGNLKDDIRLAERKRSDRQHQQSRTYNSHYSSFGSTTTPSRTSTSERSSTHKPSVANETPKQDTSRRGEFFANHFAGGIVDGVFEKGQAYSGQVETIPIALYDKSHIYLGHVKGLVTATYLNGEIYKGLHTAGIPLGRYDDEHIYKGTVKGIPVASFRNSSEPGGAIALAIAKGLL